MKTETGSSASFASLAALAASALLVSAALAASWAAAAASSLDFALALAASSCVCSSSIFAAAFCFWSSARPLARSVLAAAAAVAASVTIAGGAHRRTTSVDWAVVHRFAMPCPGCQGGFRVETNTEVLWQNRVGSLLGRSRRDQRVAFASTSGVVTFLYTLPPHDPERASTAL